MGDLMCGPAHRSADGSALDVGRSVPRGRRVRSEANLPGIDSGNVTASCDLGVLRVVTPIEQPAVRKDPPEAACFLTLGTQPCACADPGALFDHP